MNVEHWIRQTIRGAGIGAWATAALLAVPFGLAGLAIGGGESAVEMSGRRAVGRAGWRVFGAIAGGPVTSGGAVWAARALLFCGEVWPEIYRAGGRRAAASPQCAGEVGVGRGWGRAL